MPYVSENVGEIIYASMDDDAESYIRYSQNVGDFPCSIALKKTGFEYSYIYLHFISFFHNHKVQVFEILIGWMHCLPLNNCPNMAVVCIGLPKWTSEASVAVVLTLCRSINSGVFY